MAQRTCKYPGCGRPYHARGWCGTHYMQWRIYGTPDGPPRNARPPSLSGERWLPVVGWEEFYEVSSLGRVWSVPRLKCLGRILKARDGGNGYLMVTLSARGKRHPV